MDDLKVKFVRMRKKIISFSLLFLFVLGFLALRENFTVVDVELNEALVLTQSNRMLVSSPIDPPYELAIPSGGTAAIELPFEKPINTNGFSIYFPGNWHAISSYLATDFDIYYQEKGRSWILANQTRNYSSSSFKFRLPQNKDVLAFKLVIHKAAFNNTVQITDLRFFQEQKSTFLRGLIFFLDSQNKSLAAYGFYTALFLLLLLIPGYALLSILRNKLLRNKFQKTPSNIETRLIFAPIISILILALLSVLFMLTRIDTILYLYLPIVFAGVIYVLKHQLYRDILQAKFCLFLVITVLLIVSVLQAQREFLFNKDYVEKYLDKLEFIPSGFSGGYFGYHIDNTRQWGIARSFLHHAPVFSEAAYRYRLGDKGDSALNRTPFLPIILVPVLKIFGESHFVYQRFLNVLMSFLYPAFYLLIKAIFNRKTAKVTSLLMLLSVHITFQTFNAEIYPKYFSIYPVVLVIFLITKKDSGNLKFILIGLLLGMAFLTHPLNLILTAAIFLYYLACNGLSKKSLIKCFYSFFPTLLLAVGWNILTSYIKNNSAGVVPVQNIYVADVIGQSGFNLFNKLINFVNLFIPDILLRRTDPSLGILKTLLNNFLRYSLISAITPLMFLFAVLQLDRKNLRRYSLPLWFGLGPQIIIFMLLNSYSYGGHVLFFYLPFLFGFIVETLWPTPLIFRIFILISFPLFSLYSLYRWSGVIITFGYKSDLISFLYTETFVIYLLLSLILVKLSLSREKTY